MFTNVESSAAALLDGGWTPEDREELMSEYELTQDEADELCSEMERILEANKKETQEVEAPEFFDRFDDLTREDALLVLCEAVSAFLNGYGSSCHLEDPDEYADNLEFDCPERTEEIYAARTAEFLVVFDCNGIEEFVPCKSFDEAWTKIYEWPCRLRSEEFALYDLYKICTENRSVVSLLKSVKPDFFDGLQ